MADPIVDNSANKTFRIKGVRTHSMSDFERIYGDCASVISKKRDKTVSRNRLDYSCYPWIEQEVLEERFFEFGKAWEHLDKRFTPTGESLRFVQQGLGIPHPSTIRRESKGLLDITEAFTGSGGWQGTGMTYPYIETAIAFHKKILAERKPLQAGLQVRAKTTALRGAPFCTYSGSDFRERLDLLVERDDPYYFYRFATKQGVTPYFQTTGYRLQWAGGKFRTSYVFIDTETFVESKVYDPFDGMRGARNRLIFNAPADLNVIPMIYNSIFAELKGPMLAAILDARSDAMKSGIGYTIETDFSGFDGSHTSAMRQLRAEQLFGHTSAIVQAIFDTLPIIGLYTDVDSEGNNSTTYWSLDKTVREVREQFDFLGSGIGTTSVDGKDGGCIFTAMLMCGALGMHAESFFNDVYTFKATQCLSDCPGDSTIASECLRSGGDDCSAQWGHPDKHTGVCALGLDPFEVAKKHVALIEDPKNHVFETTLEDPKKYLGKLKVTRAYREGLSFTSDYKGNEKAFLLTEEVTPDPVSVINNLIGKENSWFNKLRSHPVRGVLGALRDAAREFYVSDYFAEFAPQLFEDLLDTIMFPYRDDITIETLDVLSDEEIGEIAKKFDRELGFSDSHSEFELLLSESPYPSVSESDWDIFVRQLNEDNPEEVATICQKFAMLFLDAKDIGEISWKFTTSELISAIPRAVLDEIFIVVPQSIVDSVIEDVKKETENIDFSVATSLKIAEDCERSDLIGLLSSQFHTETNLFKFYNM